MDAPLSAAADPAPLASDHKKAVSVLAFLEPEEANRLAALCRQEVLAAGEVVMADDKPGEFLAFVINGKLAVKKSTVFPGRFILLAEIERGGMVGEGAAVCGDGHGTTVVAVEKTRLLILDRQQLLRLFSEDQVLAQKLLTRIIQVLRQRLRSAGERLSWIL
ncbi:Crp/Fnr family transcriptional regulator [Desulfurivibrio sp. C05AmB]|jgi:CRP/FNR family transcriptional regulator, cyclic AMP receptor protein|uniref:Crp/Fnr family transcriptional regulator n=1 Tax=Desulfurivibrio sp. C05AmB TaxID=3374371 RepID=UPI00376EA378